MSRAATATPPPQTYFPQRNATPTMRHCAPIVGGMHMGAPRHRSHLGHAKKKSKHLPSSFASLGSKRKAEPDTGLGLEVEPELSRQESYTSVKSFATEASDEGRATPTPSFATGSGTDAASILVTPASSEASFPLDASLISCPEEVAQVNRSWVPNFGKMARAVVDIGINLTEKRKKDALQGAKPSAVPAPAPTPAQQVQAEADKADMLRMHAEWVAAQRQRVVECARLCSQWPKSGYNVLKWGPDGSKQFYEPQSYSNPQYVRTVMQRQADLERQIYEAEAMFFSCSRRRDSSSDESLVDSYESSLNSPSASMHFNDEALQAALAMSELRTAADIRAAMQSPLMPEPALEMDPMAASFASISTQRTDESMDLDIADRLTIPRTRPSRAQSCGSKRPFEDEERKADEKMVVEEAVSSGVIQPALHYPKMSASAPDLTQPAVFGHIVKTSDTHPIIISPFFPAELLPILSAHLHPPSAEDVLSGKPLLMTSAIDVPSLLLSFAPPMPNAALVPSPVQSCYRTQQLVDQSDKMQIGNLLLSSCPGKRLRMEGPIKGRGPVCRDLATDLRRIKNEGVGCLVCCLDDAEMALLGVPWETYRQVAAETGLDVIRLPMPDGFTPFSLALFDAQVGLVATEYSLKGINVLVHCRGGVGRAGLTACAWAIKMGFVQPHPSLVIVEQAAAAQLQSCEAALPAELEHQIVMSTVERVIAMIRSRRGLKAIESFEQVQFLASYVRWLRAAQRAGTPMEEVFAGEAVVHEPL